MENWQTRDPIELFTKQLTGAHFPSDQGGDITAAEINALREKVYDRNAEMAVAAAASPEPETSTLLLHIFSSGSSIKVPKKYANPKLLKSPLRYPRDQAGEITYRLAVREALLEEMARDGRVLIFGEDVAEYGGAFGVTNELLGVFGRDRVFNTSISESAIVGAAVGMAMTGLRPICEIMYDDFMLMAMDQIGNQAAKWSYMSGGQVSVPMVLRTPIGGGRGYAGQHSQSLEAIAAHMPGLIVIAPSTPRDIKGMMKSAIRNDNPVICFEHQILYNMSGPVPEEEYLTEIGKAEVKREGKDITIVSYSLMVHEAIKAAQILEAEGISVEVVDVRTLVPLDMDTIINSVKKTTRVLVLTQAVSQGSYGGDIASRICEHAFDYLDAPVSRLDAPNGIPPTAQSLERDFLPNTEKLVRKIRQLFSRK
jgi:2-oxoisovalerate dehydrogenase E1 component